VDLILTVYLDPTTTEQLAQSPIDRGSAALPTARPHRWDTQSAHRSTNLLIWKLLRDAKVIANPTEEFLPEEEMERGCPTVNGSPRCRRCSIEQFGQHATKWPHCRPCTRRVLPGERARPQTRLDYDRCVQRLWRHSALTRLRIWRSTSAHPLSHRWSKTIESRASALMVWRSSRISRCWWL
jgi:hypothetical protein